MFCSSQSFHQLKYPAQDDKIELLIDLGVNTFELKEWCFHSEPLEKELSAQRAEHMCSNACDLED